MGESVTAVVVGGASGIGAAVAARYRDTGARLVVWDLSGEADVQCDITDPAQVESAKEQTIELLGVPTQVTVTAGIGHAGMLLDAPVEDWDSVMGVNAKGVWLVMRALARPMLDVGGGSMVVVTSVSGRLADKSMGLYCASKAAADMLVRVAAAEWAPRLRVNGVAPGVTDTPMLARADKGGPWLSGVARRTAQRRLGMGDDVADSILAMHGMEWVSGEILRADGGLSLYSPIDPLGQ